MTLDELNRLDRDRFVKRLGDVFEHSPWVAKQAWALRPFDSLDDLHRKMVQVMRAAPHQQQLELIRAHPQLTGRVADRHHLTDDSQREQAGAGLDACTPEQKAELSELNCAYFNRHGFPFIVAVKGLTVCDILERMRHRIKRSTREEFEENLAQIARIARFRLNDRIDEA